MHTVHRVGIGILIGACFVTGLTFRARTDYVPSQSVALTRQEVEAEQGTRVAGLQGAANVDIQPLQTLYLVLARVREYYVEQLTDKTEGEMTHDALRAMLSSLKDPNTRFIAPDEMKAVNDAQTGKFHGIGAMFAIRQSSVNGVSEEQLVLVHPVTSGPANEAKMLAGDIVAAVDGKTVLPYDPFGRATKMIKDSRGAGTNRTELRKSLEAEQKRIDNGISIPEAQKILTTRDGKTVELTLRRKGSPQPIKIKVDEREFQVEPVTSKLPDADGVGYIRVNCLCTSTAARLKEAVAELKNAGAKRLTLDLRDLSGGELSSALDVARYLAPQKSFGFLIKTRGRQALTIPKASAGDVWHGPLVVLIDKGTARTPEVLAAALRDNGAKLLGQTTYGDSTYTSLMGLEDGSAIVMTTGKFLTSKNEDFAGKGIVPDVKVAPGTPDDEQLKEAAKLLASVGGRS